MPPRRKSQVDQSSAAAVVAPETVSTDAVESDVGGLAVGEDEAELSSKARPTTRPVSFITKQQKDAASGADGIDQYELARTQVTKVAKSAIPENIQLRKEVIQGLIKSSTVFINYLSAAALDKTHEAGNKTLSATHVINAFKEMGFPEEYADQLRREYSEKVKLEAERVKANKAAKEDAARAEGQSMDVDADKSNAAANELVRGEGDESMAVDLSKEEGEEDEEEAEGGEEGENDSADEEEEEEEEDGEEEEGEEVDENLIADETRSITEAAT